ncbi:hypothetical protein DEU56DRAFT_795566 [Suillus clintonianus]|uniref:uncharacterized protein n=1 Tax=Suillus clintonianus TaxID=1904413 RepID=UPI001B8601D9|nr:uncharacterized protein DEU56DRAFT_795566 [Suillus clintonianus]KAG2141928.1 hypothetical protein DEU56DRAFT_795566 [Suillus clintonianus]
MQTFDNIMISPVPDIIGALQTILASSRAIISANLDTPYSSFPNTDHSVIELKDRCISAIVAERQEQSDATLHEISALETVMHGIQNLREQLVKKKGEITQSMNLHKGLVSPLWRLPNEILSEIFVHCLPTHHHLWPASVSAPMFLTNICRRWREVAANMPKLWCRLRLQEAEGRNWQRTAFCYDLWLKRSQGLQLSLSLGCFQGRLTNIQSLLRPYINQVSSLSIHVSRQVPELMFTDLLALEELTISVLYLDVLPAVAQSISRQRLTLRSLSVKGLAFDLQCLSSLNSVWAHLTNVEIAITQPNAVIHMLRLCPNLSSFTIRAAFVGHREVLEPFTHTELRSLRIDQSNSVLTETLSGLFDALSLPKLRVFEARYVRRWPHEELKAFLVRSNCPLESLTFGFGVTMTDKQRAEYIAIIPSLEVVVDSLRQDHFV